MEIIECVPNFSQAQDFAAIDQIVYSLKRDGLKVLHVDSGVDAQRTVVTIIGNKNALLAGLFEMVKTASQLIDLNKHVGVHPYIGAVDVIPFIPIKNCSMADCDTLARELAQKVAAELAIPTYLYAQSATDPARANLSFLRRGNFPALKDRMQNEKLMQPDFGPNLPHPTAGASAIGARPILVAFNVSLNTTSAKAAEKIAQLLRESGPYTINESDIAKPIRLEAVKSIGWYVSEFGCAQVSNNILNYEKSPLHVVFESVKSLAKHLGVNVAGSQLVGLVPLPALIQAGKFYAEGKLLEEKELLALAVDKLGLNKHHNFNLDERVLEYRISEVEGELV